MPDAACRATDNRVGCQTIDASSDNCLKNQDSRMSRRSRAARLAQEKAAVLAVLPAFEAAITQADGQMGIAATVDSDGRWTFTPSPDVPAGELTVVLPLIP